MRIEKNVIRKKTVIGLISLLVVCLFIGTSLSSAVATELKADVAKVETKSNVDLESKRKAEAEKQSVGTQDASSSSTNVDSKDTGTTDVGDTSTSGDQKSGLDQQVSEEAECKTCGQSNGGSPSSVQQSNVERDLEIIESKLSGLKPEQQEEFGEAIDYYAMSLPVAKEIYYYMSVEEFEQYKLSKIAEMEDRIQITENQEEKSILESAMQDIQNIDFERLFEVRDMGSMAPSTMQRSKLLDESVTLMPRGSAQATSSGASSATTDAGDDDCGDDSIATCAAQTLAGAVVSLDGFWDESIYPNLPEVIRDKIEYWENELGIWLAEEIIEVLFFSGIMAILSIIYGETGEELFDMASDLLKTLSGYAQLLVEPIQNFISTLKAFGIDKLQEIPPGLTIFIFSVVGVLALTIAWKTRDQWAPGAIEFIHNSWETFKENVKTGIGNSLDYLLGGGFSQDVKEAIEFIKNVGKYAIEQCHDFLCNNGRDTDEDGIPDWQDEDDDGDGYSDWEEICNGSDPDDPDDTPDDSGSGEGTCLAADTRIPVVNKDVVRAVQNGENVAQESLVTYKTIDEIKVGDTVIALDTNEAIIKGSTVKQVYHHAASEMVEDYYLDFELNKFGEYLDNVKSTTNHIFFINKLIDADAEVGSKYDGGSYIEASEIEVGDSMMGAIVVSITERYEKIETHHFDIADSEYDYTILLGESNFDNIEAGASLSALEQEENLDDETVNALSDSQSSSNSESGLILPLGTSQQSVENYPEIPSYMLELLLISDYALDVDSILGECPFTTEELINTGLIVGNIDNSQTVAATGKTSQTAEVQMQSSPVEQQQTQQNNNNNISLK